MITQPYEEPEEKDDEFERKIDQLFTEAAERCGVDSRDVPNYRDARGDEVDEE